MYQFMLLFTDGIIARGLLVWIISLEQSPPATEQVRHPGFTGLQPAATKPLNAETDHKEENDQ